MDEKLLIALIDYIVEERSNKKSFNVIADWMASKEAELNNLNKDEYEWLHNDYHSKLEGKEMKARSFARMVKRNS